MKYLISNISQVIELIVKLFFKIRNIFGLIDFNRNGIINYMYQLNSMIG